MNRSQLDKYITDYYGVRAERLFEKNPGFQGTVIMIRKSGLL